MALAREYALVVALQCTVRRWLACKTAAALRVCVVQRAASGAGAGDGARSASGGVGQSHAKRAESKVHAMMARAVEVMSNGQLKAALRTRRVSTRGKRSELQSYSRGWWRLYQKSDWRALFCSAQFGAG